MARRRLTRASVVRFRPNTIAEQIYVHATGQSVGIMEQRLASKFLVIRSSHSVRTRIVRRAALRVVLQLL